jgi:hypothetical protein
MRNIGEEILWDIVRVIKWIAMRVLRLFGKLFSFAWDKAKEKQETRQAESRIVGKDILYQWCGERNADRKDEPRTELALYPYLMACPG